MNTTGKYVGGWGGGDGSALPPPSHAMIYEQGRLGAFSGFSFGNKHQIVSPQRLSPAI